MAMVCRVAALVAIAHANLNTGIDDLSVSLLQTRAERIHRPHHHKASMSTSKEDSFDQDVVKIDGKQEKAMLTASASKTEKTLKHEEQHAANKKRATLGSEHKKRAKTKGVRTVRSGRKHQEEVSMGQVVKETRFVNDADFDSTSGVAKLVDEVKELARDEALVSKQVSKEISDAKNNVGHAAEHEVQASNKGEAGKKSEKASLKAKQEEHSGGKQKNEKRSGDQGKLERSKVKKETKTMVDNLDIDEADKAKVKKGDGEGKKVGQKSNKGKKEITTPLKGNVDPMNLIVDHAHKGEAKGETGKKHNDSKGKDAATKRRDSSDLAHPAKLIDEVGESTPKSKNTKDEGQKETGNVWSFFDKLLGKPAADATAEEGKTEQKDSEAQKENKETADPMKLAVDEVGEGKLGSKKAKKEHKKGTTDFVKPVVDEAVEHKDHESQKENKENADPIKLAVDEVGEGKLGSKKAKEEHKKGSTDLANLMVDEAAEHKDREAQKENKDKADPMKLVVDEVGEGKLGSRKAKEEHKKGSTDFVNLAIDEAEEGKLNHKKETKDRVKEKKGNREHADPLNFDLAEQTSKKGHSQSTDPLNLAEDESDQGRHKGEKAKREHVDTVEQSSEKSEPTLVRFKGTELAKHAVHLDEMASEEETHNLAEQEKDRTKHSNAKFYAEFISEEKAHEVAEQDKDHQKHSNAKFDVKSSGAEKDSLGEFHPGWKLYELEGGQETDKPQAEEQDSISDLVKDEEQASHHKAKHHKHHKNVVSEAMGVAFGDSDSAKVLEEPEVAKLYSSTVPTDEDTTDEFWAEEEPSQIDREFTVEGIPMTSVLGKEGKAASQVALDKVDTHKEKRHTHSGKKTNSTQKVHHKAAHKDLHNATGVTNSKASSSLARTSRRLTNEEMCEGPSMLDFSGATVTHSNLGGQGPDSGEETLVYSGIADQDGYVVDLVVTATSPYAPRDATKNGLQDDFGVLNLEINSAVDLLFRFTSGGQPFVMNSFYFTFFDLDQGRAHEAREKATIRGFDDYRLSDGTSLEVEELGDSSAIFSSSMRGGKVDNPVAPLSLSHLQRERSVVVSFSDVSEFSVQLSEENYASSQGRNWFFAGPSSIVCSREAKCSTYECPDGYHIRTMAEFVLCAGSRCTRADDLDTCCYVREEEEQGDESEEEAELYSKSSARVDKKRREGKKKSSKIE